MASRDHSKIDVGCAGRACCRRSRGLRLPTGFPAIEMCRTSIGPSWGSSLGRIRSPRSFPPHSDAIPRTELVQRIVSDPRSEPGESQRRRGTHVRHRRCHEASELHTTAVNWVWNGQDVLGRRKQYVSDNPSCGHGVGNTGPRLVGGSTSMFDPPAVRASPAGRPVQPQAMIEVPVEMPVAPVAGTAPQIGFPPPQASARDGAVAQSAAKNAARSEDRIVCVCS